MRLEWHAAEGIGQILLLAMTVCQGHVVLFNQKWLQDVRMSSRLSVQGRPVVGSVLGGVQAGTRLKCVSWLEIVLVVQIHLMLVYLQTVNTLISYYDAFIKLVILLHGTIFSAGISKRDTCSVHCILGRRGIHSRSSIINYNYSSIHKCAKHNISCFLWIQ